MAQSIDDEIGLTPITETADLPGVSDAEIDAVLDDPTMSREEKLARMQELREQVIHRDDEEYAPFTTRILDALSMLAQGGHDYGDTPLDDDPKS